MDSTKLHIVFAGPPGCGKGTICERLFEEFKIVPISTGQILRDEIDSKTKIGLEIQKLVESGQYVHEDFWLPLLKNRLQKEDCQKYGFIIDGAPRMKRQVEAFNNSGIVPTKFLVMDLPDEVSIARITGRRMDPTNDKIYHLIFNPPKDEQVKQRLIQRLDDSEDKCKTRLKLYREHFATVDTWYPNNIIVHVNANQPIDKVHAEVKNALGLNSCKL